jgi:stage IV sporulation protein A
LQAFSEDNGAVGALLNKIKTATANIERMRDCFALETLFGEEEDFCNPDGIYIDLGTGRAEVALQAKPQLFYRVLSEECGEKIEDDLALIQYMVPLFKSKRAFEGVQEALKNAEEYGYGIVYPSEEEYALEKPQLVKKNAGYGVRFKATATSYHIIRVDVNGEVSPIIGTKQQGEEFVDGILHAYDEGAEKVWETNIFGKSLRALVGDEFAGKADGIPTELRKKVRRAVTRIVNDGKGNLICFVF